MDLFSIWNDYVSESKGRAAVKLLRDHYNIPLFEPPTERSRRCLNTFYHAKYNMFTCFDSANYIGMIDIDPNVISYWESNIE